MKNILFHLVVKINKKFFLQLMNEMLNGIKVLKLYAWEIPFMKRVKEIRNKEIKYIKYGALLWALLSFTWSMSPFLITIGCFT